MDLTLLRTCLGGVSGWMDEQWEKTPTEKSPTETYWRRRSQRLVLREKRKEGRGEREERERANSRSRVDALVHTYVHVPRNVIGCLPLPSFCIRIAFMFAYDSGKRCKNVFPSNPPHAHPSITRSPPDSPLSATPLPNDSRKSGKTPTA